MPARQQVTLFLIATLALGYVAQLSILHGAGTVFTVWTTVVMWIPAVVAAAVSYFWSDRPLHDDFAIRQPSYKYLILAYAVPAAAAIFVLFLTGLVGIGQLRFPWDRLTVNRLFFAPTFGVLVAMLGATGAELGWRGFLLTKLNDARAPYPYVITGLAAAAYFWPVILFGNYAPTRQPAISLIFFTVMMISFAHFLGQLRKASRSVWPCVLAVAAHTTWIQFIYPYFLEGGGLDPFFGGESGVLLAMTYLSLALYLERRPIS